MTQLQGKKILLLITQSKYGGAQRYVLDLARHFGKHNTVSIAVGEAANRDEQFFSEARSLGIEPIIVQKLIRNISLVSAFEAVLEIRKLLARERPDVLHINSSMAGAIGSFAAWLYRFDPLNKLIRVFYTVHGFVFNEPMAPLRKRLYLFIERATAGFKHALITVSEFDKKQGIEHKIAPERKLTAIHVGIDPALSYLSRAEARNKLGISEKSTIVGCVASFYPTKNLPFLVESFALIRKELPEAQLMIIGDGPERELLENLINEKKLERHIQLHAPVANVRACLTAFDACALSSVKEGFPFVLLEAGLAGVPIIATKVGGIPELIEDKKHGFLVESNDREGFADSLRLLLTDKSNAGAMAQKLRARIRSEFTLEQMLEATEHLYQTYFTKVS